MDNYKYDGLIARAKITEMISKVQCEVAKQQRNCENDRLIATKNGFPTDSFDEEYKNLGELYNNLNNLLDNFR